MFQFFTQKSQIHEAEKLVTITGADVNHISHVLRMKPGEQFYVTDGESAEKYLCALKSISAEQAVCDIVMKMEKSCELPCEIVLYQGLPKADKLELIIQKAVELGAARIVPVVMKRSVVKLDEKKAQAKISRWQGIAEAAAKQSKRDRIPQVGALMSFREALREAAEFEVRILPYENASGMAYTRSILEEIRPGQRVAVFIGPEGGFEESEVTEAMSAGMKPVTLGSRILRTETAGLAVLAMLSYVLEP